MREAGEGGGGGAGGLALLSLNFSTHIARVLVGAGRKPVGRVGDARAPPRELRGRAGALLRRLLILLLLHGGAVVLRLCSSVLLAAAAAAAHGAALAVLRLRPGVRVLLAAILRRSCAALLNVLLLLLLRRRRRVVGHGGHGGLVRSATANDGRRGRPRQASGVRGRGRALRHGHGQQRLPAHNLAIDNARAGGAVLVVRGRGGLAGVPGAAARGAQGLRRLPRAKNVAGGSDHGSRAATLQKRGKGVGVAQRMGGSVRRRGQRQTVAGVKRAHSAVALRTHCAP